MPSAIGPSKKPIRRLLRGRNFLNDRLRPLLYIESTAYLFIISFTRFAVGDMYIFSSQSPPCHIALVSNVSLQEEYHKNLHPEPCTEIPLESVLIDSYSLIAVQQMLKML